MLWPIFYISIYVRYKDGKLLNMMSWTDSGKRSLKRETHTTCIRGMLYSLKVKLIPIDQPSVLRSVNYIPIN